MNRPFARAVSVSFAVFGMLLLAAASATAVETTPVDPSALAQQMEAMTKDVTQGALRIQRPGGEVVECPLKHTDVQVDISGFIARVRVTQTFFNPLDERIEAVYVFPLPHKSAVDDMTMVIGQRRIVGLIKRRAEARQIYEQALAQGMTAALLEQERPNIFTQSVGNIDPKQEIKIEISYVDVLEYDMGTYEFHFPMVVGPRYIPGGATSKIPAVPPELKGKVGELDKTKTREGTKEPKGTGWAPDTDRVPDASRITPPVLRPEFRNGHDVSLSVTLDAGVPIQDLRVTSHQAEVQRTGDRQAAVRLSSADSIPNKAFVMRYGVVGKAPAMAMLAHTDQRGQGYFMLMVQPADDERTRKVPPREICFLVDVSGSMSGQPTAKVIDAMRRLLKLCKPEDTVQVITFANQTQKVFPAPVPVSDENIQRALKFTEGLRGGGGTEMLKGIQMVLNEPVDPARVRIVIMLTDGFIGNEAEIIAEVGRRAGDRIRFWCIGIGSDPNRFLIDGVARQGGGMSKVLGLNDDADPMVQEIMFRIHRAQLSDIEIIWGGLKVFETYPAKIPELWAGRPVILFGLYVDGGQHTINLCGNVEGQSASWPFQINLPQVETRNEVLAKVWARNKIEDLMQQTFYAGSPEVEDVVTSIALEYRLMSQYTSFVAVDEKDAARLREPARPPRRMLVPVPIPEGTRFEGFFGEERQEVMDALVLDPARSGGAVRFKAAAQSAPTPMSGHLFAGTPRPMAPPATLSALPASAAASAAKPANGKLARGVVAGGFMYLSADPKAPSESLGRSRRSAGPGGAALGLVLADAARNDEAYDADEQFTGAALREQSVRVAKRAEQVLKQAQELQKKGDHEAARAKFSLAYLLNAAAGQGESETSAAALAGMEKAGAELLKARTTAMPGLDKPLSLVLRDQSVADALAAVAKAADLVIRLVPGSVEDAAAMLDRKDIRITYLDLKNATAAQALDWILTPARMAWWTEGGAIVAGTVRRGPGESAWVYDVAETALPTETELKGISDYDKQVAVAKKAADAFIAAARKVLGGSEDTIVWFAPGQVLVVGDAGRHAAAARFFSTLADPKVSLDGDLAEFQKTTAKRAEGRKEAAAKMHEAGEKVRTAQAMSSGSWRLLAGAARGELDLEALTEVEVAWRDPATAGFLKGPGATIVLRSFWSIAEAARALPREEELTIAAKAARERSRPAAEAAIAALEKSSGDAAAYFQVLYAAMAMRDDEAFVARAAALLQKADPAKFGRWPVIAAALLGQAGKIDAKAMGDLFTELLGLGGQGQPTLTAAQQGGLGENDVYALTALACRRAGGDLWNKFRAESRDLIGRRPLSGSVVVFINSLSRPNMAMAAAKQ
jgi:Ca-activated chloride channel family protein